MLLNNFSKITSKVIMFLFLWIVWLSPVQAEEIRYFLEDPVGIENALSPLDCGHPFKFGGRCKFKFKVDMTRFKQLGHYWIAYYKKGKITKAIKMINPPEFHPSAGKVIIIGRKEFDSQERLVLEETLPNDFGWMNYFLKKIIYLDGTREASVYSRDGTLRWKDVTNYKNGKALKTFHYDEKDDLVGYGIHHFKEWETQYYSPDHEPTDRVDERTSLLVNAN